MSDYPELPTPAWPFDTKRCQVLPADAFGRLQVYEAIDADRVMRSSWLPIELAPKDGTKILALTDEGTTVIYWWQGLSFGTWDLAVASSNAQDSGFTKVLMWMPLPQPPKA